MAGATTNSDLMHATCVSVAGHGVLLIGPPGAGKSDLALRLMHGHLQVGGRLISVELVADDQVIVEVRHGRLCGRPPPAIAGQIEVRGLGILSVPFTAECDIGVAVQLVQAGEVERFPDPRPAMDVLGHRLPLIKIAPFEASAPLKVVLAALRQMDFRE